MIRKETHMQQQYLSTADLRQRFGVSRMWIVRHENDDGFPKAVRFGTSRKFYAVKDVVAYERRCVAGKEAARAAL